MRRINRWLTFAFVLSSTCAAWAQPKKALSICEIRSEPTKYLRHEIIVTGEVQREYHGTTLSSAQCPTLGAALVEDASISSSNDAILKQFRDGSWDTSTCANDHVLKVTLRGRFGTARVREFRIYRVVFDKVLSAEFTPQLSRHCTGRSGAVPAPPDVKLPPQRIPDFSH